MIFYLDGLNMNQHVKGQILKIYVLNVKPEQIESNPASITDTIRPELVNTQTL